MNTAATVSAPVDVRRDRTIAELQHGLASDRRALAQLEAQGGSSLTREGLTACIANKVALLQRLTGQVSL